MKIGKLLAMAMVLGVPALGCGDDTAPGDGDGSGSATEGTSTGMGTSTTMVADDSGTTAGSGSAESGSESSSSSGEPPPVEVTAEGEVVDLVAMGPIAGAEIGVFELPGVTATADDMGLFSIGPLTANTQATFVVAPTTEYWGSVIPVAIAGDPLQDDVQLAQLSSSLVDDQIMLLEPQMPAMPDLDQAIMIVRLINPTAIMEGATTIDMVPAPAPGTFYAPDPAGAPVLDKNTIDFTFLPVVVYFNVPDTAPGDIQITATHPTRDCTVLFPDVPTIGQHMTLVDVECLPP